MIATKMQIEKNLTSTYDPNYLLTGYFIFNGNDTVLYVYQNHIAFNSLNQDLTIHFNEQTLFQIVYVQQKIKGIKFITPTEYYFINQNWYDSNIWENTLIKKLRQKNFHQYYRPIKKIGKGNFASVYLAHNKKEDTLVAVKAFVKQIAFKNNGRKALNNQINLLRKLSNSHIMKLFGVYETENSLYIVTQYIEGVTLESFLKTNKGKLTYEQRKNIMRMILKALNQMQLKGILHRDLKPQNIMITRDGKDLKIVDFGLATETNLNQYIFVRCGTPGYVAPQILRLRDDEKPLLHTISDMFSLGSIFYQMTFQKRLFDAYQHQDVLNQNRACVIRLTHQMKTSISFDQADLLQKMLNTNPKQRISASKALQHPYISQKAVNIFGSMRNRISKPVYMKASRKQITSLDKSTNHGLFHSLNK